MNSKGRQGTYALLLLFVGIFAFWWGIAVLTQNSKGPYAASRTAEASPLEVGTYTQEGVQVPIAIQTSHKGSLYTYSGTVPLTSVCDKLGTGISVTNTNPAHITVVLTLQRPVSACRELGSSSQPFAVSLTVASGTRAVLDGVTVNGVIAATQM